MEISEFKEEFRKLLNVTVFPSNVSNEEYFKQLKPIEDLVRANTPLQLFRYRSCNELNLDSFRKDTIWAVNPSKFNDPHDSLFFANRDYLYESICSSFTSEFRQGLWNYYQENKCFPAVFQQLLGDALVRQMEQRLSEMTLQECESAEITPPSFDQVATMIDQAQNYMRSNTKIACLSERIDNSLMWAHYADYHKGFALEYDFLNNPSKCKCDTCNILNPKNCSERKFVQLYPVIYSDKQYDATHFVEWYIGFVNAHRLNAEYSFPKPDSLYAEKVYLNKSKIWEYECEWRLIGDCRSNIGSDSMVLENNKPQAIYYGAQISSLNKEMLMKICDSKGIKQYQMYIDHNTDTYELKSELISD